MATQRSRLSMQTRNGRLLALLLVFACAGQATAQTVVAAAKDRDRARVQRLLQQRPAEVNAVEGDGTTALHWASYHDDVEMSGLLLRAGARVNAANDLGATPLWLASQNGSAAMVRRLLRAGANPNVVPIATQIPKAMATVVISR